MKKKSENLKNRKFNEIKKSKKPYLRKPKAVKKNSKTKSKTLYDKNQSNESDEHFANSVKKALKEALEENEKLREQEKNLRKNNLYISRIINDKIDAIKELAEYYKSCKYLHFQFNQKGNTLCSNQRKGLRKK
jgi:hypothetical protein